MGHRRSPREATARRAWDTFVKANAPMLRVARLPAIATQSIEHWDELLMHGHLDHHLDPSGFAVTGMSEDQYRAYVAVVDSYFAAGYEYYAPRALRPGDQQLLSARYRRG